MKNRTWRSGGRIPIAGADNKGEIWIAGRLRAIVSQDGPDQYWHISVSHADGRYPTWDEIADARYDLCPNDIDMALILPPPADYTNYNPRVLQLTEVRDPAMPIDRELGMLRTRETILGTIGMEHQ
jgi:hypothetical protein